MGELEDIRRRYEAGELDAIREDLERFIRAHREQIVSFQQMRSRLGNTPLTDELALRLYVIKQRSINPQREIRDQIGEIEKEKWIRGIQTGTAPDESEVAREWALNHGAAWRSHRVATVIFLLDVEQVRFLKIFRGEDEDEE